jgi:hypothetical protein
LCPVAKRPIKTGANFWDSDEIVVARMVFMRKLPAVEEARAVMRQGIEWGVFRWLMEKRRVRQIADGATAALDEAEAKVRANWSEELTQAYEEQLEKEKKSNRSKARVKSHAIAPEIRAMAAEVKAALDEKEACRLDAEARFDEAERRMSTQGARDGAARALETYDLHEKAIRKAEAAARDCKKRDIAAPGLKT